jgi:3-carboxy-cis,cis-muconate cycloisomerase
VPDFGLLTPGTARARGVADDEAVHRALLDVECAWVRALAEVDAVSANLPALVAEAADHLASSTDVGTLAERAEAGGNPVIPVVGDLREAVRERSADAARWVHRGLTSQDVLDSALMLIVRRGIDLATDSLSRAAAAGATLARAHRDTVMVGRTLGQHAVPTTFGAKAAQWVAGLLDARDALARAVTPMQLGGAVGTLAAVAEVLPCPPARVGAAFAAELGLADPGLPWHVQRQPVLAVGGALAAAVAACGHVASDVVTLSRPELGEVAEPAADGRGVSSTMPQKRNPVLSVLIRRGALQVPQALATLHAAAGLAADERPDGPWHAEWQPLRTLVLEAVAGTDLTAELLSGLHVEPAAMRRTLDGALPAVLSERLSLHGVAADAAPDELLDPTTYLGAAAELVDRVVARAEAAR